MPQTLAMPDHLERARRLGPVIDSVVERIERERRLVEPLLSGLHEAQLYRMLLPRDFGGAELPPPRFFEVIEQIARHDASTAWCLCQGNGCAMSSAYLDPAVGAAMFAHDPRAVLAWGPPSKSQAVAVKGGYRVTGTWSFASGGRHATWLGGVSPIVESDGTPRKVPARTMLFPTGQATWSDTWNVVGLCGTASDTFAVEDLFVPEEYAVGRDTPKERRQAGKLYRFSSLAMYSSGFAGVALGIARAMLDDFIAIARDKTPRGAKSTLRDNAVIQSQVAQCEAKVQSARNWLLTTLERAWDEAQRTGEVSLDTRMTIRLASTHGIHQGRDAVDTVYAAAGATAIFHSSPFQRRFRDVHTVTQQVQGRQAHFENVGAYMLGHEADMLWI